MNSISPTQTLYPISDKNEKEEKKKANMQHANYEDFFFIKEQGSV